MRVMTIGLLLAAAAVGCSPRSDRAPSSLLEQGRLYTSWLYGSEYQKLWDRFSPDMRQTFGTVGDLAIIRRPRRHPARLGKGRGG